MMVAGEIGKGEDKANMPAAATIRNQVEATLAKRIPSALTPAPRTIRPVVSTGIAELDAVLRGGFPLGAITEITGNECSGRTSLTLSFLAQITSSGKVCAWIDVSDSLDPVSAAASGVDLPRLLWVRCGVQAVTQQKAPCNATLPSSFFMPKRVVRGLHGGGHGPHPRSEAKGLSTAVQQLLRPENRSACIVKRQHHGVQEDAPTPPVHFISKAFSPLNRLDQALRVTDLILQSGGFSAIVLDMSSIAPDHALRVPLATWFRYRAAAEKSQASIILLTQHACAKSSAGLVLNLETVYNSGLSNNLTLFHGMEHRAEVARQRFTQAPAKVIPLRKPPHRDTAATWRSRPYWAGLA